VSVAGSSFSEPVALRALYEDLDQLLDQEERQASARHKVRGGGCC
jgi:hypothetical protein